MNNWKNLPPATFEEYFTNQVYGRILAEEQFQDAETKLNQLGIFIRNEDGSFKSLYKVLEELSGKWIQEGLSDINGVEGRITSQGNQ